MQPRVVEFSEERLPLVLGFECGPDDWALRAAKWIQTAPPFPGALLSMKDRGNRVFLYFAGAVDQEHLIGFSSLGTTRWRIPPPDGPKRKAGFLPMLAIASAFQGRSVESSGQRYSHAIMKHLVSEARQSGFRELCLFVHEDNARALRFYEGRGFQAMGPNDSRGLVRMLKFLD